MCLIFMDFGDVRQNVRKPCFTMKLLKHEGFVCAQRAGKLLLMGRLSVKVVYHAFYTVLHQWYIPVQKDSEFKIGKFMIS